MEEKTLIQTPFLTFTSYMVFDESLNFNKLHFLLLSKYLTHLPKNSF